MFLSLSKFFLKIVNKERADLNVQASSRANVLANVCQGSILDPLFFLFISIIYQMMYPQTLNYLLMIHLFFQVYPRKSQITTYRKCVSGLINGKLVSNLIPLNNHKSKFSLLKLVTQRCFLKIIKPRDFITKTSWNDFRQQTKF